MLNSNATCQVRRKSGNDAFGKSVLTAPLTERCAIVTLRAEQMKTTFRAENSGTRGHAEEFLGTHKILLSGSTSARLGDQLLVRGHIIKIISMTDRIDVLGHIDHYEVEGMVWAS